MNRNIPKWVDLVHLRTMMYKAKLKTGKTYQQMAEESGLAFDTVKNYYIGRFNPQPKFIKYLSGVSGIPVRTFFKIKKERGDKNVH